MCGHYVSPGQASIESAWRIGRANGNPFPRRYNVQPTTEVPLLRLDAGELVLAAARWGLVPHWWKQDKPPAFTINARLEEAAGKPMWRDPMRHSRCLLPAEGWYEWQDLPGGKQPHHIRRADGGLFCFAGLMSVWQDRVSCAVLTKAAAGPVAEVHDRMPVVLPHEAHAGWLDAGLGDASAYARDHALYEEFTHYRVSTRVNNARHEGPELLDPLTPPP